MRAEAGGEAVWGVTGPPRGGSLSGLLGRGGRRPRPPVPGPRPPPLCFPREKTPTNHPGKSVCEGRGVREIADLSAGDDLRQTTVAAFVVFFPPSSTFFFLLLRRRGPFTRRSLRKHSRANPEAGNVGRRLISDRALRLPNVVVIGGDSPGG